MPDYGKAHKRLRAWWGPKVYAGVVDCARCGQPIHPDEDAAELGIPSWATWDLGHDDDDPDRYTGPEHARRTSKHPACNRATTGRRVAKAKRLPTRHPGLL